MDEPGNSPTQKHRQPRGRQRKVYRKVRASRRLAGKLLSSAYSYNEADQRHFANLYCDIFRTHASQFLRTLIAVYRLKRSQRARSPKGFRNLGERRHINQEDPKSDLEAVTCTGFDGYLTPLPSDPLSASPSLTTQSSRRFVHIRSRLFTASSFHCAKLSGRDIIPLSNWSIIPPTDSLISSSSRQIWFPGAISPSMA